MRFVLSTIVGASLVSLAISSPSLARAPAKGLSFDGRWSVEIITEQGDCDRAYRWAVGIENGRVVQVGDAGTSANGAIDKSGHLAVSFSRGNDVLTARGALSDQIGTGTWLAPSRQCSGRWRAERRQVEVERFGQ